MNLTSNFSIDNKKYSLKIEGDLAKSLDEIINNYQKEVPYENNLVAPKG